MGGRSARNLCDIFNRDFRRAVGAEQSVRFLKGIGKLSVAESAKKRRMYHRLYEFRIHAPEFDIVSRHRVAPGLLDAGLGAFIECYASKLGKHDRLAPVRVTIEGQDTPPGRRRSNSCSGLISAP